MKEADFAVVEEGGITAYVNLEEQTIKLIQNNPKIFCPNCKKILILNGRCRSCPECGWSSCE